jgi:hypothetical protein
MQATVFDEPAADTEFAAASTDLELAFVLAPRQNLFFAELVEALRREAESLGVRASLHVGNFPAPSPEIVYVLVPPHEYFTLMHGRRGPSPETLKRTLFICAEQPGTPFFDDNVTLAPRAGALFDINRRAVRAFRSRGVDAQHLQVGWTQGWDHLRERERDIDVLFMGCISDRRSRALASYASSLWRRRTYYVLSDNSRPNWAPSDSFRADEDKWDLLGRAKVMINLHQGDAPYFEWLRIVQAMSNGAVLVSEHSVDHEPLVAGQHFISGSADSLGLLTELLLDDGDRWWEIQTEAYRTLRDSLLLRSSVEKLVATASSLARAAPVPAADDPFFRQPQPDPERIAVFSETAQPASPAKGDHNAALLRRAAKDVKLELLSVRRDLARIELTLAGGRPPAPIALSRRTGAYSAAVPRVTVLTALYNYEDHIPDALDSVVRSHESSWELIVVDDGSSDRSAEAVNAWMDRHPQIAALFLRHPVNGGLASARNSALGWARGEFCFVLDADNELYPHCLERLVAALEENQHAAFSYGIFERFRGDRPFGLLNTLPWDPPRFRSGNYIDAMALIRTTLLRDRFGGYSLDRRLHGWEDFDLWCRFAEAGLHGAFVPEILAKYRTNEHSMLSLTNISATEVFSLLIERYPRLMRGLTPPE